MPKIILKPFKDYNKGVGAEAITSWDLIIRSKDQQMLEGLRDVIEDMFIRCDNCKGDVVRSDGKYLCLSGCGHVEGEVRGKN